MITVDNRPVFLFTAVSVLVILPCYLIIQSGYYFSNPDIFSLAVTIDIVFFIPLMYFLLFRKRKISKITIVPVIILSYLTASILLPSIDHEYLETAKILLVPLELFAIGFIIYKIRLTVRQYKSFAAGKNDFLKNLRSSLYRTFGENLASDLITTEVSIFYYGFFGWTKEMEKDNEKAFTYHKRCGYSVIVGVFFFLIILETFSLHLLISRWSAIGAWVLTALSIYGLLFLIADHNAAKKRPILVDDHNLHIRIAFRWFVCIPFENISRIDLGAGRTADDMTYLNLSLIGSENVIIELKEPMKAKGFYGISKNFIRLGLSIDNKEEFQALIKAKINGQ